MKNLLIMMLSLALFTACAEPSNSTDPDKSAESEIDETPSSPAIIQGMPAVDFYNQFLYKESRNCGGVFEDPTEYISSDTIEFLTVVDGRKTEGTLHVYLEARGKYSADYYEYSFSQIPAGGNKYVYKLAHKMIQGKWSITADGDILLGDLGRGQPSRYNGDPSIDLKLGKFFENKETRSLDIVLKMTISNMRKSSDKQCGRKL